jgi:hypothetical protein
MKKRIIISVCALLVTVLILGFCQMLVVPKYADNREGALVSEYYSSSFDHDIIFVGDCEVYETFVPAVLYEEYATLKKVEYVMGEDWMKLVPINPQYQPKTISGADLEQCKILGIPKLLIRQL